MAYKLEDSLSRVMRKTARRRHYAMIEFCLIVMFLGLVVAAM